MKLIILILIIFSTFNGAYADEAVSEKITKKSRKFKRAIKKSANRINEEKCLKGKVKCLTIKGGNRIEESAESIKDSTEDTVNKSN